MAPIDPEKFSELSNALQTALLLASRQVVNARQGARDAADMLAAVERAALAAKELRPYGERKA